MSSTVLNLALQLSFVFSHITISNLIDITLVAIVLFVAFQALNQTRALQLLRGVIVAAIIGGGLLVILPLNTLSWLVRFALIAGAIALPILFQDELRRVFVGLGQFGRLGGSITNFERFKYSLITAVGQLSHSMTGALIVLEGKTLLQDVVETGIRMQAEVISPELLLTIFTPKTPLHDGAVVLRGERLVAASCILPVETQNMGNTQLGTRHRAALGLSSKVQDTMIIIVSEETGWVSVAFGGRLYLDLAPGELDNWIDRFGAQLEDTSRFRWNWLQAGGLQSTLINVFFSIVLAIIAWVIVIFQTNPPGQVNLSDVPLSVNGPSAGFLLVSELPSTVGVQVQTTGDRINTLSASSVQAVVDLDNLTEGIHSIPVRVVTADPFIQTMSVTPTNLDVSLEIEASKTITPTVRIVDLSNLPPGYAVQDVTLAPRTIQASGPQSVIDKVAGGRFDIQIGNRRTDFQESGAAVLLDSDGALIEGADVQPDQVVATVTINRIFFSREVGVQAAVDDRQVGPDYEVTQVEVIPSTVTLTGSQADLNDVGPFITTAPISLTNQTSDYSADVPLIVPSEITVLNSESEVIRSVRVQVTITPVTGYLVLEPLVHYQNALNDEEITVSVSPQTISVLLIGPRFLLDKIRADPSLVIASIHLTNTAPGTQTVQVQIEAPAGLEVQLFPKEVQVTIE
ncbi:MAG: TIGR00159 family protein [Anaerolineae bacterium UTCFX2]|jgi:diadenylate cyclase|nr:diadenylate cyclase CdaA [Anaerolineales bacterium]OQY88088.1 MAG: TIGR00159 family protein [Anaerolineae bacterium UTCFX2]